MSKQRRKKSICPNCGWKLEGAGNYCSNCGQENHDLNVPLRHLLLDLIENTFHFDTKLFRSLGAIILSPGKITRDFNKGMHASYVSPVRLYIFITAIYFLVFAFNRHHDDQISNLKVNTGILDLQTKGISVLAFGARDNMMHLSYDEVRLLEHAPVKQIDSVLVLKQVPATWINRILAQKFSSFALTSDNRSYIGELVYKNISLSLFLLMPLFALLLRLMYWRKKILYIHHLVFALHYHSVLFFILLLSETSVMLFSFSFINIAWTAAIVYLLTSMYYVYGDGWLKSFIKFLFIVIPYLFLTCICIGISAIIAFLFS